jgi:hypothetical protein
MPVDARTVEFCKPFPLCCRSLTDTPVTTPFGQRGLEINDGWLPVVHEMLVGVELEASRLLAAGLAKDSLPILAQIKEKFGALRVYIDKPTAATSALVSQAESMSTKTCEVCGEPGRAVKAGWIQTLCPKHAAAA